MSELFGLQIGWDAQDFTKLVMRMGFDLFCVWVVIGLVYVRLHARRDFAFSCVMLNIITFAICLLLRKVPVEMGFALGLFAVFGILRYRTEPITARDLTYLFVVLGIAMLNAVANKKVGLAELVLINGVIIGITAFLEYTPFSGRTDSRLVIYDRLDLLRPERRAELVQDLTARLGVDVIDTRISNIDLLRDTADLIVTTRAAKTKSPSLVDAAANDRPRQTALEGSRT